MSEVTIDSVPVAFTPEGGYIDWPGPILVGCGEPLPDGAPDLRGFWRVDRVTTDGVTVEAHPMDGHISRIEQAGDRLIVTSGGVIHDMRCDGTLANGVHDVAAADKVTAVDVVAAYEQGVHVLRPDGIDIEVRRWRDGEHLMWEYVGFTARMVKLAEADADPATVVSPDAESS